MEYTKVAYTQDFVTKSRRFFRDHKPTNSMISLSGYPRLQWFSTFMVHRCTSLTSESFTAGLNSTICVEMFHQQSHGYGESARVPILCGDNRWWHCSCSPCLMKYRLGTSLWPTPRQQLKTASSTPSFWKVLKDFSVWGDDEYLIPATERSTDSWG